MQRKIQGSIEEKNQTPKPVVAAGFSRRLKMFLAAGLLAFLLGACSSSTDTPSYSHYTVEALDPTLGQVYETLGGEAFLGPIISEAVYEGNLTCQLTLNAAVCINPVASGLDQFVFAPLGRQAALEYQSPNFPNLPGSREVNGVAVYPAFEPLFDQLFGVRFAGAPVTPVLYNEKAQRLEQYFENIAMAADLDDPTRGYLLPLGHDACEGRCIGDGRMPSGSATPLPAPTIHPGFLEGIANMDGFDIIGAPLTWPYESPDGYVRQVFTNVVLQAPKNMPGVMELTPLSRGLGMTVMDPVHKQYDKPEGVVFYNNGDDAAGFHVPIEFDEFIDRHGGRQMSGDPVAEVLRYGDGSIRQCFENYCLDYNTDPSVPERVSMYALGARYLRQALEAGIIDEAVVLKGFVSLSGQSVRMVLAEEKSQVSSGETQVLHIGVFTKGDNLPITDVAVHLKLILPDGSSQSFGTLYTGSTGQVVAQISGLPPLENGSLVVYEACLDAAVGDQAICESDAYIIWNTDG